MCLINRMGKETLTDTFSRIREKLHTVACRILKDETEADDAVQDAFCNIWSATEPSTDDEARYRLFAALKNVCLNKLRRKKANIDIDGLDAIAEPEMPEETERIRNFLLATLTPLQRKIFIMATYGNFEYEQIATRLGLSPGAVRTNMSRARKKMREEYYRL